MKFAGKMILMVSVLLALSLSVGGFVAVERTLQSELETACTEAQTDMRLFGTTLQALCLMEQGLQEPEQTVKRVLQTYEVFDAYSYWVYDGAGNPLSGTGEAHPEELTAQPVGIIETRVRQQGGDYAVFSSERLRLLGREFVIQRGRSVTELIRNAERNLGAYELVMLGILLVGVTLTTLLSLWMTLPLRRISRTAKQLAGGRYDRRVTVQGGDELARVALDFNQMADALEEKIHALEAAAQRQKEFTASFAHELKTPLTSVIGYADTLRSRALSREQQILAADYILSEGKRLEAMSFALLDLFSLEREAPAMRPVSVTQLCRELVKSADYLLKKSGVTLQVQVEPGELTASPELLKTLLYNLLDNARKASRPGSRVELTGAFEEGGYRFTLRDWGRGIPPEALARLTEPFYMVDKSRARAQGGAGLGLTLCKRIVEAHSGTLTFESVEGEGTTVRVWIGGAGA